MTYATREEITLANELGYSVEESIQYGNRFTNGNRNVWAIREGWQTADLIDGSYCNHKAYTQLEEALKRELFK